MDFVTPTYEVKLSDAGVVTVPACTLLKSDWMHECLCCIVYHKYA